MFNIQSWELFSSRQHFCLTERSDTQCNKYCYQILDDEALWWRLKSHFCPAALLSKVFLYTDCGVCCHCGPHSTVVHSRVWHCSRGDVQMDLGLVLIHFNLQSRDFKNSYLSWSRVWHDDPWWFSWILSIPEEIIIRFQSRVCVGQSNRAVF